MSSPLRRAIQTASIAFGPTIRRPDVASLLLVPLGQEISDKQCDIGHDREELQRQVPALLSEEAGQDVGFDFSKKIDFSLVEDGWNSKVLFFFPFFFLSFFPLFIVSSVGRNLEPAKMQLTHSLLTVCCTPASQSGVYATDHVALTKRAALLRSWLYQRPEPAILFVTHGAFLHYLTEDWSGDDPERGRSHIYVILSTPISHVSITDFPHPNLYLL